MANIYLRREAYDGLVKLGFDPAEKANEIIIEWLKNHEQKKQERD